MMRHLVFTLSQHVLILFSRALVMFLVFILTFAFWLFYGVRIFEKAEPNYHSIGECASYLCTFDLLQLFKLHSCETETTGSFPRLILCSRGIFRPRGRSWRAFVVKHLSLWTPPPDRPGQTPRSSPIPQTQHDPITVWQKADWTPAPFSSPPTQKCDKNAAHEVFM